jgi:hypothetical protein
MFFLITQVTQDSVHYRPPPHLDAGRSEDYPFGYG